VLGEDAVLLFHKSARVSGDNVGVVVLGFRWGAHCDDRGADVAGHAIVIDDMKVEAVLAVVAGAGELVGRGGERAVVVEDQRAVGGVIVLDDRQGAAAGVGGVVEEALVLGRIR